MKTNTSPLVNMENFKTMVLLKKLKEEEPAWLPEDEFFYQRMEKNIMMAIEDQCKKPVLAPIEIKAMAMSQRHFVK